MRVLIACECSGRVRDAFICRGYDAMSCDLFESETPGPHYKGDVRDVLYDGWDMMVAHPECTYLSNCGAKHLYVSGRKENGANFQRWRDMVDAAEFYIMLRNAPIPMKIIENPIMHLYSKTLIQPINRQIVQPWHFGDPAFKATGFELINVPQLKKTNVLTPPKKGTEEHKKWSWVHREPPGPDRKKNRSRTFPGIANAIAEQYGKLLEASQ